MALQRVLSNTVILRDVMPCSLVECYQRFGKLAASIFRVEGNGDRAVGEANGIASQQQLQISHDVTWFQMRMRARSYTDGRIGSPCRTSKK
jgi:hypothetical protein